MKASKQWRLVLEIVATDFEATDASFYFHDYKNIPVIG